MGLVKVGNQVINVGQVRRATIARKGEPGKTPGGRDAPISRDGLALEWADGRTAYLWDRDALIAWDHLERCCPEVHVDEWTPAAVRRADLAELAELAGQLRQSAEVPYSIDPLTAGHLAARLESVRGSIAAGAPAPTDDDGEPEAPDYELVWSSGDRIRLTSDLHWVGAAVRRIAGEWPGPSEYPVLRDGEPWGTLRIGSAGRWEVCSADGSIAIRPPA